MVRLKGKDYFLFLKELVLLEETEENEEIRNEFLTLSPKEREFRGKALLSLRLVERHFSQAGHPLATFNRSSGEALPLFSLEVGDIASLFPEKESDIASKNRRDFPSGTVYEKTSQDLTVAFNETLRGEGQDRRAGDEGGKLGGKTPAVEIEFEPAAAEGSG